ncbi:MAG: hypothetical protein JNL21_15795 [Myxococcales bacterium]|nr:hypothetical protein [Myxococcales bacterium]
MLLRLTPLLAALAACSLDGLADGGAGAGGTGGLGTTTSSSPSATTAQGGAGGEGGGGGQASAFTWLRSIGNGSVQGTSPYPGEAGSGSTLRVSEPGPAGEVWLAFATRGSIDPDGPGGLAAAGNPDSHNLFALELANDGTILHFSAFPGSLENIDDPLSVGAVVRLGGGGVAVVGSFKGGTLDLGAVGTITQNSLSQDDGFVLKLDASGLITHARQLGSGNAQTARAAVLHQGSLLVAGKTKRTLAVTNPNGGAADAPCALSKPMEEFERALVVVLDDSDLACTGFTSFTATDANAAQQAWAITADATGVFVAGSYTRQIIAAPIAAVPASSSEDGFVVALEPDMGTPTVRWVARATSNRNGAPDGLRAAMLAGGRLWIGGYLERGTTPIAGTQPEIGVVDALPGNDCTFAVSPEMRDGVVATLDPATGSCSGALLLGGPQRDEVRALVPHGAGAAATGLTTEGIPGLDQALGAGSRDGFLAWLSAGTDIALDGGFSVGGVSWDYLDAARTSSGALILAGSYDVPFDVLEGDADFFVGAMPEP